MTTHDTTPNPILEAARKLQEQKLTAVQRLVASRGYIADLAKQLADAERQDAAAYQQALRGGWSESELRQIGITPPARKAPGRPRTPRAGGGTGSALVDEQLRREAEASVALDRDETHAVGDPYVPAA